jgi:hypothetical protein
MITVAFHPLQPGKLGKWPVVSTFSNHPNIVAAEPITPVGVSNGHDLDQGFLSC